MFNKISVFYFMLIIIDDHLSNWNVSNDCCSFFHFFVRFICERMQSVDHGSSVMEWIQSSARRFERFSFRYFGRCICDNNRSSMEPASALLRHWTSRVSWFLDKMCGVRFFSWSRHFELKRCKIHPSCAREKFYCDDSGLLEDFFLTKTMQYMFREHDPEICRCHTSFSIYRQLILN